MAYRLKSPAQGTLETLIDPQRSERWQPGRMSSFTSNVPVLPWVALPDHPPAIRSAVAGAGTVVRVVSALAAAAAVVGVVATVSPVARSLAARRGPSPVMPAWFNPRIRPVTAVM